MIQRNYLGPGYIHTFRSVETGEMRHVQCSRGEYQSLNGKNVPTLEGHVYVSSAGGTIKVDTPDGMLGKGEYVNVGLHVFSRDTDGKFTKTLVEDFITPE